MHACHLFVDVLHLLCTTGVQTTEGQERGRVGAGTVLPHQPEGHHNGRIVRHIQPCHQV